MTNDPKPRPELNFYRFRQLGNDAILLTVDSGEWCLVSPREFALLKAGRFADDRELTEKLLGCHVLLTPENRGEYEAHIRARWREIFAPPSLHIVVVTPQCNLRCIYCHAAMRQNERGEMTEAVASEVIDKILAASGDALTLEIQGGEPLLNFEVVKYLVTETRRRAEPLGKHVDFAIVTNFTNVLTDEKIRFLIENEVSVSTSVDGPRQVHESNRNRVLPRGFDILRERIDAYRRIWREIRDDEPQLSAMLTATRDVLDKPRETVDAFLELGFDDLFVRPVNPLGRGARNLPELDYPPEAFVEYWRQVADCVIEYRQRGIHISEYHLELLLLKLFFRENGYMDLRFPCGASYGQRTYDFDGSVFTCDEGRMIHESLFRIGGRRSTVTELNRSRNGRRAFLASLAENNYCEFCACKPFCGVCPILNFKETGHPVAPAFNSRRCRIYRGMIDYVFKKFIADPAAREVLADIALAGVGDREESGADNRCTDGINNRL